MAYNNIDAAIANFTNAKKAKFDAEVIEKEIKHWFFDIYFNHWVDVGAGRSDDGPEFVLQYWGTPMFVTADQPAMALWLLTDEEILKFLSVQHERLQASGYTHTNIPDRSVRAYNPVGGAIEVIWSRCAPGDKEIQRFVVHFECAKIAGKWKVIGVHNRTTHAAKDENSIAQAWIL